jgi:hypothetical protein
VFPFWNWRLESRQNPQAGKPALPLYHDPTSEFGFKPMADFILQALRLQWRQIPTLGLLDSDGNFAAKFIVAPPLYVLGFPQPAI